jgi:hypothetical protein
MIEEQVGQEASSKAFGKQISACFHAYFLLGFFSKPEVGGGMFLLNVI